MSQHARHLLEEALRLPTDERAELAAQLLRSLAVQDSDPPEEGWEQAWTAEITKRLRAVDQGEVSTIDGDEALKKVRARLKRASR